MPLSLFIKNFKIWRWFGLTPNIIDEEIHVQKTCDFPKITQEIPVQSSQLRDLYTGHFWAFSYRQASTQKSNINSHTRLETRKLRFKNTPSTY